MHPTSSGWPLYIRKWFYFRWWLSKFSPGHNLKFKLCYASWSLQFFHFTSQLFVMWWTLQWIMYSEVKPYGLNGVDGFSVKKAFYWHVVLPLTPASLYKPYALTCGRRTSYESLWHYMQDDWPCYQHFSLLLVTNANETPLMSVKEEEETLN